MSATSSIDSYIELRESLKQEVAEEANRLGERNISWPSVEQRARQESLQEYYPTVFYLFSQDNHMSADSLFRFIDEANGVTIFTTELDLSDLDQEIQTAYVYYLQFIHLCAEKLGFPDQEELKEFNSSEMLSTLPFS